MKNPYIARYQALPRARDLSESLRDDLGWFFLPLGIALILLLILCVYVLPDLNPRFATVAKPVTYASKDPSDLTSLRLAIVLDPTRGNIRVNTSDRQVFTWPADSTELKASEKLKDYLSNQVKQKILKSSLLKDINAQELKIILAADETLRFHHIRPILYAMAESGISSYGFETLLPFETHASAAQTEEKKDIADKASPHHEGQHP